MPSFIRIFAVFLIAVFCASCAAPVATPTLPLVDMQNPQDVADLTGVGPAAYPANQSLQPLPEAPVTLFRAGGRNVLELPVDAALAAAYRHYFAGEGAAALDALAASDQTSPLQRYHIAEQRIRTLIMMGRAAEAETASEALGALEIAATGTNVNAMAYRAEARLWLEDYAAAERDALNVAHALQGWVLPSSYGGPPTNMAQIVLLTTAQLRAYTVLAGLYSLQENPDAAVIWADAGERGYNTVHGVAADPLYGIFLKAYPDSYYGRAFNLLFRGSARAIQQQDFAAGAADFAAAEAYFNSINYRAGIVAAAAMTSWTHYTLDQDAELALAVSDQAVQLAIDYGFPDYIWRISALRGEVLLRLGRDAEAEKAFRQADAAIDQVTGGLATDRAKTRYGIGKQGVTYQLVRFDLKSGDHAQLVTDLERGRARAFVDMLAGQKLAADRSADLATAIRSLTADIRAARLKRLAPLAPDTLTTDDLDAHLDALIAQRRQLVLQLRQSDPELADVFDVATVSLAQISQAIPADDALVYALPARGDDPVQLLVITARSQRVVRTDMTADSLRRMTVLFQEAVTLQRPARQQSLAEAIEAQLRFADWKPAGRLLFVPAGDFFFLPWGALPSVGETVILPTGGWVLRTAKPAHTTAVALLGDPEFGGDLPQLTGARREVGYLAQLFDTDALIGAQATRSAMLSQIGDGVGVLHIATHGVFDADQPLNSALYLSTGDHADRLTAADVVALSIPADLVVLSACDTGMGVAVAGEDFLGLARSFYLGGTRAVVNSLWPVDDAGTQVFMQHFHQNVRAGDSLTSAWLSARNTLKYDGYPPSVYGAFVVGGSAEPTGR